MQREEVFAAALPSPIIASHCCPQSRQKDRMNSSVNFSARPLTLKALCSQMCVFYSTMCLAGWPLASEAARRRCGSDLLSDLIFVCGDRGIYFGKGTWSGYGARPRGKGIVDKCCRSSGCELHHLEMYCAKPKVELHTTTSPATSTSTPTAPSSTTQTIVARQFEAVFQRRLAEHLGAPAGPKRSASRKTSQSSPRRKNKQSASRRKINSQHTTSKPS